MQARGPRMTGSFGVDVDIETGEPMPDVLDARAAAERQRAQEQQAEAQAVRIALESHEGNLLLARALEAIEARVDQLIRDDPQCQGMLRIMEVFNEKLQLGRRAAQRLLDPLQRRPTGLAQGRGS